MPIPANQVTHVEIAVKGIITGGGSNSINTVNVFHFRRTATVLAVPKGPIDAAFQAAIVAPLALALNNRWTQQRNDVRYLNDANDSPVSFAHALVGAVAGDSMTSIEAAFILMRTGLRGKSNRGSKHFGPLSESDTTGANSDILNAGAIALWTNVVTPMLTGFTDATGNVWIPSIVSRKLSVISLNPTNIVSNDVSQVALNKRIGRLRHREAKSVY